MQLRILAIIEESIIFPSICPMQFCILPILLFPTIIPIMIGTQGPSENLPVAISLPNNPAFDGFALALQAAHISPTTPLELSNPVVVIVN